MRRRFPGPARRWDVLLALVLAAVASLPPDEPPGRGGTLARVLLALAATLPIAAWRARPVAVLLVVAAALGAGRALGHPDSVAWLALGVAVFGVASRREPRLAFPVAGAAALASLGAPLLAGRRVDAGGLAGGLLALGLAALLGDRVLARRTVAAEAVRLERDRIARELHDSLAHALSVVAVQADAADAMIGRDDGRARDAVAAIRATARESLADVRRLVGAVRGGDLAPQPGTRDLPALVDELRASGVDGELVIDGEARPLPPLVDLAAYRIVQEALTNVRRHAAAAHARVALRFEPDALVVEVTDDGRGPGSGLRQGHGLPGMRERAALCGGVLEAGPANGGGFRVVAILPEGASR